MNEMQLEDYLQLTRKVIGVGPNFRAVREQKGLAPTQDPFLFIKSPESLTTQEQVYLNPELTTFVCEVEMAVVIGQDAKQLTEDQVPGIVAGYALANDITASAHVESGRFKMFDQLTPIGGLTSIEDPRNVDLELWVNGELIQKDNTANLVFSAHWLVAHISHIATLRKGDIILTGTPLNARACQFGDIIELRSPQLGYHKHILNKA
jgi:2-keto-4-pentenoate hydratase/2-oxohepta-3-ene-1,7-dioic acid hydratase in catechol pathway